MSNTSLPLSTVFNVSIVVAPTTPPGPSFNQALIVGSSAVIPSVGANSRVRLFTTLTAVATAGFSTVSPEYLAAQSYFAQLPQPTYLWIGRQDLTALETVTIGAAAGTSYMVNDVVTVVQAGGQGGLVQVTSVGVGGAVTGIAPVVGSQGTGYAVATNLGVTGGSGTGLEVTITAVGETPVQAVQACRATTSAWYCCAFVGTATDSDHQAIAAYIESQPASTYVIAIGDLAILNNTAGNLGSVLKALGYRRTMTIYTTTQSGAFPNNIYASAAVMGRAMGLNTETAGSYFGLKFKSLASVAPEPLTQTQVTSIEGLNVNLYLSYQNGSYTWLEQGVMASGAFFDEVLFLDMLASAIQTAGVNLLVSVGALPITDAGVAQMKTVISQACDQSQAFGFIAPSGTWRGVTIGPIGDGTSMPKGYFVYAPPVSTLTQAQRSARQFPPISVLMVESESGDSFTVALNVQQ